MPTLHMCFRGNPGTGKTTVARIVGRIFSEEKILSEKDRFVEAQRSDLIGEYIGQTSPKTKGVIKKAKDEKYKLSNNIKSLLKEEFCIEKRETNFANARAVRNLFEKIKFEQADRVAENKDEDIDLIKKCDVKYAISKLEKKEKVQKRIGFAC